MTQAKKEALKDIITRASKTFVQAFVSSLGVDAFFGVTNTKMLEKVALSILVGALASGICAVWNSLLEWINVRIDEMDIDDVGEEISERMGESNDSE